MPTNSTKCLRCGATVSSDSAKDGLCAECRANAGSANVSPANTPTTVGTTPFDATKAEIPSSLAEALPQLDIIEALGQGGLGIVYKARQKALDRFVALKVLRPEISSDAEFESRFNREARALGRLNHPNIVSVYDFGHAAGQWYLIMEFVDGPNLRQIMAGGELTPERALALVGPLCDAVTYAHDEGVVHRDIKPENILVDTKGRVKIADFGLARLAAEDRDLHITTSGQVMGTLHYMAPEQVERPLEVDHRADIYALGVVIYEMLTGELPLGRFALPSEKAHTDARLDDIVMRALSKEPASRFQSASEIKTAVESVTINFHAPESKSSIRDSVSRGFSALRKDSRTPDHVQAALWRLQAARDWIRRASWLLMGIGVVLFVIALQRGPTTLTDWLPYWVGITSAGLFNTLLLPFHMFHLKKLAKGSAARRGSFIHWLIRQYRNLGFLLLLIGLALYPVTSAGNALVVLRIGSVIAAQGLLFQLSRWYLRRTVENPANNNATNPNIG